MKSAEERDAVVAAAQAVLGEFPTFSSLPEAKKAGERFPVERHNDVGVYTNAVYAACAYGVIEGRNGGSIIATRG